MNSVLTLATQFQGEGFYIAQWKTSQLAIFSYYIQSKNQSILIDPVYDVKTYNNFINQRKSHLKYVLLTHYHADYLSGHNQFKVPIVMGPTAIRKINNFKVKQCTDKQILSLGSTKIQVIHTPGHTMQSSCFLLYDATNKPSALFSGDTVFLGQVGRPDLACSQNITSYDLAAMLYDSIQKIKKLDGSLRLYPGHGSGSACGKSIGAGNFCTVGAQNTNNYGFKFTNKQQFVKAVAQNLPKPPSYFFHDAVLNQKGAEKYDHNLSTSNIPLSQAQFLKLKDQVKVIQTRSSPPKGIIRGSYWMSSNGSLANFISNCVKPEEQFIIIAQQGKQNDIIDRLFRIGYFNMKGYAKFDINNLQAEWVPVQVYNFLNFKAIPNPIHLDVRSKPEQAISGVVQKSICIPIGQLQSRINEVKGKQNIVINCATGLRARLAFSVLAKYNINSKVLAESFSQFKNNGINVVNAV